MNNLTEGGIGVLTSNPTWWELVDTLGTGVDDQEITVMDASSGVCPWSGEKLYKKCETNAVELTTLSRPGTQKKSWPQVNCLTFNKKKTT